MPFESDALRANITSTAEQVVIPDRYLPLLAAADGFHGVKTALTETVAEYFHSYRNVDHLVAGFQSILLRNWPYLERSDDRVQLFELLSELVCGLLGSSLSNAQFSLLLRGLLGWCKETLAGRYGSDYDASLCRIAETLISLETAHATAFLERDALLRNLVVAAQKQPTVAAPFARLYRRVLLAGYWRALRRLDVPDWALTQQDGLTDPEATAEEFALLSEESLRKLISRAETALPDELVSDELPVFSDVVGSAIGQLTSMKHVEDRFAVCLFLLKDDTLGYRQKEVMADLLAVVKQMVRPDRHVDTETLLTRLTAFFRGRDNEFLLMRFQCYEAVGVAIGEASNAKAADHIIEDILSWRFQYPEIAGATDEWEIVVNPYHLPKIRCWLHIIESNPPLYERLAAALNVQLRLGGVYIADTDLFQRDVTRFLNANIRPIYFVAKQLLRALPVYFREVGAEGELRAVSTQLDEICERHDTLMHFLRKQVHAESSNRLVPFSREVLRYWVTLDPSGLEPYVSANTLDAIRSQPEWARGPHEKLASLRDRLAVTEEGAATQGTPVDSEIERLLDAVLALTPTELADELCALESASCSETSAGASAVERIHDIDGRRVALVVRTHQLVAHKYSLAADDVGDEIQNHLQLSTAVRRRFLRALAAWRAEPAATSRDRLLDAALTVLEQLKAIILNPTPAAAVENLYQKRHIAAGIPSIYGNYSEPKFDALGLSFRLENLVARLLDDVVAEGVEQYITRASLRRMAGAVRRFERALAVDGVDSGALSSELSMLEASFGSRNFTFHQYQNIFQFLFGSVTELSARSILSHDQVLHATLVNDPRQCEIRGLPIDAVAEMVLREVLVSALGMQALDRYAAAALRQISLLNEGLDSQALTRMMNYDPERLVSPIHKPKPSTDDQMTLGFKGLGLKQMAASGQRVPQGFILSTELFNAMPAMTYKPLYDDTMGRVELAIRDLEEETNLRLGDPTRALLLSIRSGAPMSMPGLMTTFVNVGLNAEIAEALATREDFAWAAWDSYRRFLQSWAMYEGVDRDFFDAIMTGFKSRYGVEQKLEFSAEQMRKIALTYKMRAEEVDVVFVDDPLEQIIACIGKVLASWEAPDPRLYREYTGIAEEWGTGVVVQRMVFGNLSRGSGSGVTFTSSPLEPYTAQVRLFGDFAVRSQGEDLVGGLVFPLPISEAQRLASPTYRGTETSLETEYPEIYRALLDVGRDLVGERGLDPQEIEFTFESPAADDLYILQKRAVVQEQRKSASYFDTSSLYFGPPVAVGMGVAGDAYSGRAAVNANQIDRLLADAPDENIVLLRPDTVPEDIFMITRVNGILTARGGATSHAAVTAKRLGKTAVVECLDLEVVEREGYVRLAGRIVEAGDWLSIDGRTGNIYLGRIPTVSEPPVAPAH